MSQKEHGKKQVKKAVCGICASGCPMDVYVEDGKIISVEGSKDLPGQSGGLCAKGAAARQYIYNQERLLYPMKQVGEKGQGKFVRISWEEAYQTIAEKLLSVREQYGARSTIFYAASKIFSAGTPVIFSVYSGVNCFTYARYSSNP